MVNIDIYLFVNQTHDSQRRKKTHTQLTPHTVLAHFVFRKMHIYSNIKRIDCFDAWHHYSRACFYFYSVINETERSRTTTCDWIGRERKKRADYWNNYPSTRHICFFFLFVVVVRIIPTSGIQSNRDAVALTFDFRSFEREVFFFFFFFGLFFVEKVHLIIDNETSQGNREKKKLCIFLYHYLFCKQMRIHFCACSPFARSQNRRILLKTKYELYFSRVEDFVFVFLVLRLRADFACYSFSYFVVVVVAHSKWRISSACYDRRSDL